MRDGTLQGSHGSPAEDGERRPEAPPVLSDSERNRVLYQWNDTRAEYPDACAHELFEQQVNRDPDAIALVSGSRRLTYRELNERANQVAHFLRKEGVGPDTLVGVSLGRSPELVIGLLGVWKAGGAYVPLDPAYPRERLSFMLEDSGTLILLTEEKCKHLFPSCDGKMVCLDTEWSIFEGLSTENPRAGAESSNLAYVMYTSGSTGRPKGAMILHGGLVNYLTWAIKTYGVGPGSSVPVHTSVSFDLTVTSLYPALLAGGHAELLPEDVAAQSLLAALRRGKDRALVKITPAHLDVLGRQLRPDEVAGLTRLFVIGGENLTAESLELWRERAPDTRLINEYGPTETVVGCCVHEVRASDPHNGSVPIGKPIANTQLYVLGPDLQPVAPGVAGELYIGGAGVARGYLNRPELTQERFLPDPFSGRSGARIYKTGDLARYRADGVLEYLGRLDNQVKVRGYRIELGEIEATLAGHPAVQSCAVLAPELTPGNRDLVGYVVPRPGQSPAIDDLKHFVRLRLPDYMTPAQFVIMGSFPLTENGKIDRNALPAPGAVAPTAEHRDANTATERALAGIWQRILHRERVGTRDDFFDIGGNSLLVVRMVSEIRQEMGIEVPLSSILAHSMIESLAAAIDGMPKPHSKSRTVPRSEPRLHSQREAEASGPGALPGLTLLRPGGPRCFFFVFDGDGEILPYLSLSRLMPQGFAVYGISPFALPGIPLGHLTIPEIARYCIESIRRRQPKGPYSIGGLCAGGEIAFEVARQLEEGGDSAETVVLLDSILPKTPTRQWALAKERWRRFSALFANLKAARPAVRAAEVGGEGGTTDEPAGSLRTKLSRAAGKARNLVQYEFVKAIRSAWVFVRQQLLRYLLAHGLTWPRWIPSLTVREIYNFRARSTYLPSVVCSHIVLVKAGEGADFFDSSSNLVHDPFLGWKEYAGGAFDVVEVPGGHSGMMMEPNVSLLSRELVRLLGSGSRDGIAADLPAIRRASASPVTR